MIWTDQIKSWADSADTTFAPVSIVPQLRQMGLVAEGGEREREPRLTLVFDRDGWSPRLFRELRAIGIAVVTWIKGPQRQRWPDSAFRKAAIPGRAPLGPATLEGQLAERKLELGQGCQQWHSFRNFVKSL